MMGLKSYFIIPIDFTLMGWSPITNHQLLDRKVGWQWRAPYDILRSYKEKKEQNGSEVDSRNSGSKYVKNTENFDWSPK